MSSPAPLPSLRTFAEWFRDTLRFIRVRLRQNLNRYCEARDGRREQHLTDLFNEGRHPLQLRMKVSPEFPCPACGNTRGNKMKWASALQWPKTGKKGALVTQCGVCHAAFGRMPIFSADDWRISLSADEAKMFEEPKGSTVVEIAKRA